MSKTQYSTFLEEVAALIACDREFKSFHEQQCSKGVFRLIKSKFEEMLELLKAFSSRSTSSQEVDLEQALESGNKVFAYYEYKLFTWVSVWFIHRNHITYSEIFTVSLQLLKNIFKNKPPMLLRFEFFLILSHICRAKRNWTVRENRMIEAEINKWQGTMPRDDESINWKLISYRMFANKMIPRTPHECRQRWINHVNPYIKKGKWTPQEDIQMLKLYQHYGQKWSLIARLIGSRNEHMIKNRFNSLIHKWTKKHQGSLQRFKISVLIDQITDAINSAPAIPKKIRKSKNKNSSHRQQHPSAGEKVEEEHQFDGYQKMPIKEQAEPQRLEDYFTVSMMINGECLSPTSTPSNSKSEEQPTKLQVPDHNSLFELPFNVEDYDWLDKMIEEKNMVWFEENL